VEGRRSPTEQRSASSSPPAGRCLGAFFRCSSRFPQVHQHWPRALIQHHLTAVVSAGDGFSTPTIAREFTGPDFPAGLPRSISQRQPRKPSPSCHHRQERRANRLKGQRRAVAASNSPTSPRPNQWSSAPAGHGQRPATVAIERQERCYGRPICLASSFQPKGEHLTIVDQGHPSRATSRSPTAQV